MSTPRARASRGSSWSSGFMGSACHGVDRGREIEIALGESLHVVAHEVDRDLVPRVAPVRMVVRLLGGQGDARHERERLGEVGEDERAMEPSVAQGPVLKARQALADLRLAELPGERHRVLAYLCALTSWTAFASAGTISNASPTMPKSAILKIGASASLLIATITLDVRMPARCWIAPEMPTAM